MAGLPRISRKLHISRRGARIAGIAAAILILVLMAGPHVVPVLIIGGAGYVIGRLHGGRRPGSGSRTGRRAPQRKSSAP